MQKTPFFAFLGYSSTVFRKFFKPLDKCFLEALGRNLKELCSYGDFFLCLCYMYNVPKQREHIFPDFLELRLEQTVYPCLTL